MKTSRINGTANTWEKRFFNIIVPRSDWHTVSGFDITKYKAEILLEGVTEDMTAEVFFTPDDADAGVFSGGCLTSADKVILLARIPPIKDMTIPTITVSKVVK